MTKYVVTVSGKQFQVELTARHASSVSFNVDGNSYTVAVQNLPESRAEKSTRRAPAAFSATTSSLRVSGSTASGSAEVRPGEIRAPIPGIVSAIKVVVGEQVAVGDTVVVIEAMKMENPIRATANGVVKRIEVTAGGEVKSGALLVEIG